MDAVSPEVNDSTTEVVAFQSIEQPFVGQWNQLVSTTNWEKGRIIHDWRDALIAAGAPATEYSDDAWSQRVGGVTGQHVGRLRRVYSRFGATHERYEKLYWSHFQAALDWDDAEMWLEGASQNDWSVAAMRHTRWQTLNDVGAAAPQEEEIVAAETDEDFVPFDSEGAVSQADYDDRVSSTPVPEGPDFGDEEEASSEDDSYSGEYAESDDGVRPIVRPFENLAELPADFAEAFDAFKLSILRHKSAGWSEISRDDVLGALDALKELALAPADLQA